MDKVFKVAKSDIKNIATGMGSCIATDLITVNGHSVGYMYREESSFDTDSGWRFMAGSETQDYMDVSNNSAIYDINTIANYDNDIVSLLDSPVGSAYERSTNGIFQVTEY